MSWRWVPPNELATPSKFRDSTTGPGASYHAESADCGTGEQAAAPAVELLLPRAHAQGVM
jgi:hypothetical protein